MRKRLAEILDTALRAVAQFGRVVIRRGYGTDVINAGKWREALVRLAFTPCLQYRYATGKNTSDLALALDALEVLFDHRAETFCLVTSDSDFSYLCRKLRERGATVCVVGEAKTPEALRNASDHFFEWLPAPTPLPDAAARKADAADRPGPVKPEGAKVKRRPLFVVDAVTLLAGDTAEGKVDLGTLGQYLKRTNPDFTPKLYGHSGLLDMIKTYDKLEAKQESSGHWSVGLAARPLAQESGSTV